MANTVANGGAWDPNVGINFVPAPNVFLEPVNIVGFSALTLVMGMYFCSVGTLPGCRPKYPPVEVFEDEPSTGIQKYLKGALWRNPSSSPPPSLVPPVSPAPSPTATSPTVTVTVTHTHVPTEVIDAAANGFASSIDATASRMTSSFTATANTYFWSLVFVFCVIGPLALWLILRNIASFVVSQLRGGLPELQDMAARVTNLETMREADAQRLDRNETRLDTLEMRENWARNKINFLLRQEIINRRQYRALKKFINNFGKSLYTKASEWKANFGKLFSDLEARLSTGFSDIQRDIATDFELAEQSHKALGAQVEALGIRLSEEFARIQDLSETPATVNNMKSRVSTLEGLVKGCAKLEDMLQRPSHSDLQVVQSDLLRIIKELRTDVQNNKDGILTGRLGPVIDEKVSAQLLDLRAQISGFATEAKVHEIASKVVNDLAKDFIKTKDHKARVMELESKINGVDNKRINALDKVKADMKPFTTFDLGPGSPILPKLTICVEKIALDILTKHIPDTSQFVTQAQSQALQLKLDTLGKEYKAYHDWSHGWIHKFACNLPEDLQTLVDKDELETRASEIIFKLVDQTLKDFNLTRDTVNGLITREEFATENGKIWRKIDRVPSSDFNFANVPNPASSSSSRMAQAGSSSGPSERIFDWPGLANREEPSEDSHEISQRDIDPHETPKANANIDDIKLGVEFTPFGQSSSGPANAISDASPTRDAPATPKADSSEGEKIGDDGTREGSPTEPNGSETGTPRDGKKPGNKKVPRKPSTHPQDDKNNGVLGGEGFVGGRPKGTGKSLTWRSTIVEKKKDEKGDVADVPFETCKAKIVLFREMGRDLWKMLD